MAQIETRHKKLQVGHRVVVVSRSGMGYGPEVEGELATVVDIDLDGIGIHVSFDDKKRFPANQWTKEGAVDLVSEVKAVPAVVDETLTTTKAAKPKPVKKLDALDILGQDKAKKLLEIAVKKDMPVLLVGDTGCGKTTIVKSLAKQKGKTYIRYNLTGETTVDEFVGKYTLHNEETVWEDGVLIKAMKNGDWLIVDEINVALPEILFILHSLLDDERAVLLANHEAEVVKPHKDFRFFATMNPVDEYAGTKDLNKAFKSRFNVIINMGYPTSVVESQVVAAKTPATEAQANQMVDIANAIRQAKEKSQVFYTCSTRDLLQWGNLLEDLDIKEAFEVAVLSKANGDSEKIAEIYKQVTGQYLDLQKKGVELRIDFFTEEYKKILKARQELDTHKDKLKQQVVKEIMGKLAA